MAIKIPIGEIDDTVTTWRKITVSREKRKVKISDDPPKYEFQEVFMASTEIEDSAGKLYEVVAPLSALGTVEDRQGAKNVADALIQVGIAQYFKDPAP